jgi:hypothetical protein
MGTVPQPTLNQALEAPPIDLAQGYLWVKFVTQDVLPAAGNGVNIQLGGEAINTSNVEEYQRRHQERLSIYREAIKQRGYKTISGSYGGKTTEACARIQSAWVSLIREGRAVGIETTLDNFDAQVIVSTEHEGKKLSLANLAAIAESSIALQDAMNSDYFFLGTIKQNQIEIKPDVSVLRSWPKWSGPPSQKDLENCLITLEAISDDSEKRLKDG